MIKEATCSFVDSFDMEQIDKTVWENMDRRQKKTREAIFRAFVELLSEQNVQSITVGQIIDRADVGRATFYAHFETKEFLLRELCDELFCHLFDAMEGDHQHRHIFECDAPESVFVHLFRHLKNNDNQLLRLLSGENRDVFLHYFTQGLLRIIESQLGLFPTPAGLPSDYWQSHIASAFVNTLRWWMHSDMIQSPEEITGYFMLAVSK